MGDEPFMGSPRTPATAYGRRVVDLTPTTTTCSDLVDTLKDMLALVDYHFPLAAAQRQYRRHYYGLNSAALLEDLYYDTLFNYLHKYRPDVTLDRPPRGEKAWDYRFGSLAVSHKSADKVSDIAVLWDATKTIEVWSGSHPMVYSIAQTSVLAARGSQPVQMRTAASPGDVVKAGSLVLVVAWPSSTDRLTVLDSSLVVEESHLSEVLPFESLWRSISGHISRGGAANDVDVLVTNAKSWQRFGLDVERGFEFEVDRDHRAGFYVFDTPLLQNLPIKMNNRGQLLEGRSTVRGLVRSAEEMNLMTPFPTWFGAYAGDRPPDLFMTQRAEFDSLFSAASTASALLRTRRGASDA